jgi:hypothetical protein
MKLNAIHIAMVTIRYSLFSTFGFLISVFCVILSLLNVCFVLLSFDSCVRVRVRVRVLLYL